MGIFQRIFGKDESIPEGDAKALIQIANSDNFQRAEQAILALGKLPFSEGIFECLWHYASAGLFGAGYHSESSIAALGLIGHPRAVEHLVEILDSGSLSWKEAAHVLSHPRNNSAVPRLLKIALNDKRYICVKAAVEALEGIGTCDAKAALAEFRQQPSRELSVTYFETPETVFSSDLGQVPGDFEIERARWALDDPIKFGTRLEAINAVKRVLAQPGPPLIGKLENYLRRKEFLVTYDQIEDVTKYPSQVTRAAVDAVIKAAENDAPARKEAIRKFMSKSDLSALAAYVGRFGESIQSRFGSDIGPSTSNVELVIPESTASEGKVIICCPICRQPLRLPAGKIGTVKCPSCEYVFEAST